MTDNDTHFDANGIPVHVGDVALIDVEDDYGHVAEAKLTVLQLLPGGMVKVLLPGDGGKYPDEVLALCADGLFRHDR